MTTTNATERQSITIKLSTEEQRVLAAMLQALMVSHLEDESKPPRRRTRLLEKLAESVRHGTLVGVHIEMSGDQIYAHLSAPLWQLQRLVEGQPPRLGVTIPADRR